MNNITNIKIYSCSNLTEEQKLKTPKMIKMQKIVTQNNIAL